MAYYVVVHHRRDSDQPWSNTWIDDDRLEVISTTGEIAQRCDQVKRQGERVFVHRCGWEAWPPVVCCSLAVKRAIHDEKLGWVEFHDHVIIGIPPLVAPGSGQNSYEAPAPDSGRK